MRKINYHGPSCMLAMSEPHEVTKVCSDLNELISHNNESSILEQ